MNKALKRKDALSENIPGHIIDLERYPVHLPKHPRIRELVARCRDELDEVGCAVIPKFVREESLDRMRAEAQRLMPLIHWSEDKHNPYMNKEDTSLPEDHPQRFFQKRSYGFINSDILEHDSDLRAIYDWDGMVSFVGNCLGVKPIYCWADPLGRNPYSVLAENSYFPWHFDGNEFTVSILVQEPEAGGVFEYAPEIRSPENENFVKVKKVLQGSRDGVKALTLTAGDMQVFKGRFSLHRVTQVTGKKLRIIALPTYVTDPYTVNRPEHAKQFYGRALPIHYERESYRPDSLTD